MAWKNLVSKLVKARILKTPDIIRAFNKVDRANFMPEHIKQLGASDTALPIGFGQTISQPTTVAFMLERLHPQAGDKALDIGFGSGWTTALLAELVGKTGQVFSIEIVEKLYHFGKENVKKAGYKNTSFFLGSGTLGLPKLAPFDRILVSAAASQIPLNFKKQLDIGGRLIIPIGNVTQTLTLVERKNKNQFAEEHYPGFMFVKLKD
jgi:protein-L-isoaspartate(D-aspartate) O-methyltransferase